MTHGTYNIKMAQVFITVAFYGSYALMCEGILNPKPESSSMRIIWNGYSECLCPPF